MATSYTCCGTSGCCSSQVPAGLAVGWCSMCGHRFEYSKAVPPPRTCGRLVCMKTAGEVEKVR
jgi:hypothetical protein